MDDPFHGEFSSSDASALDESGSRILLYLREQTTAYTLKSSDQVVITDIEISVGATALQATLYDGADATVNAGERIAQVYLPVNGSFRDTMPTLPHYCQLGTWPKVKASIAGNITVTIRGTIRSRQDTAAS